MAVIFVSHLMPDRRVQGESLVFIPLLLAALESWPWKSKLFVTRIFLNSSTHPHSLHSDPQVFTVRKHGQRITR